LTSLRIIYFGTYRKNYARNRLMIDRLRSQGFDVVECHATLWKGLEDREQVARGGWLSPAFWLRAVRAYFHLIRSYFKAGDYDIMVVGYPGQADMPLARLLTWLRRKPLVWDIMMSIYLIALERKVDDHSPLSARLIHFVESLAIRLPDLLIVDTPEYASWYEKTYGVSEDKIRLLPLGADDRVFYPQPTNDVQPAKDRFRCVYYGTYIPNHGVQYILEAARLLQDHPEITFELIGRGPQLEAMQSLARDYGLSNVTFIEWLEEPELVKRVAQADVCLGTFGCTPQSLMTMQHKIQEGLAMARPLINGDSPVMRRSLQHGEHIYLCERENPQSLANAILDLQANPELRKRLAQKGYEYYVENLSMEKLAIKLAGYMREAAVRR